MRDKAQNHARLQGIFARFMLRETGQAVARWAAICLGKRLMLRGFRTLVARCHSHILAQVCGCWVFAMTCLR
jgi:hypothetical protein